MLKVTQIDELYAGRFTAMASDCEVLIETDDQKLAEAVSREVADEAWRIEKKYSRYRSDNLIHRLNHARGSPVLLDEESIRLTNFAAQCVAMSDGLFDPTSGVLGKVWKFDRSDNVPAPQEVASLLAVVGWEKVNWNPPYLTLAAGQSLDFGGFGKEYAVDRAASLAASRTDQPTLVNFGGDLFANRAPSSGSWRIGVDHHKLDSVLGVLELKAGALATSGDAERFLLKDGVRYPHVLNPKTGFPVMDAPHSVSVAAPRCIDAGFLATYAMLLGEDAEAFLEAQGVHFWIQRGELRFFGPS